MQQNIIIKLQYGDKIRFIINDTGESGTLFPVNNKVSLLRGRIYFIPVSSKESLDNWNIVKIPGRLRENIDVRNVENGIATIIPIKQGFILENDMILGVLI